MKYLYYSGMVVLIIFLSISLFSCASLKSKREVLTGIKGTVIPVDEKGRELILQDRSKIIINVVPINNTESDYDRSITVNSDSNGNFEVELKPGSYSVEIFLEGFYVKSFKVELMEKEFKDLGKIYLKRIESQSASPIKDGGEETIIQNEGDVNIQPPSY